MGQLADQRTSSRAATLRIRRGARTLTEIPLGRARLVVGGGRGAQLRLKNAGLAEECIALDMRQVPFRLESLLGNDQVLLNGVPARDAEIRPGDRIEFLGIVLELLDRDGKGGAEAADAKRAEEPDPYMGKATAAKVKMEDVARARDLLQARRRPDPPPASRQPEPKPRPAVPATVPPAPSPVPGSSNPVATELAARPASPTVLSARPGPADPWLEFAGSEPGIEPRLRLFADGVEVGRQAELMVAHGSVSKRHARFERVDGELFVIDSGSTNGTWVNRERVLRRALADGDVLHFGAVEFRVRIPDAPGRRDPLPATDMEISALPRELPIQRGTELDAPSHASATEGAAAEWPSPDRASAPELSIAPGAPPVLQTTEFEGDALELQTPEPRSAPRTGGSPFDAPTFDRPARDRTKPFPPPSRVAATRRPVRIEEMDDEFLPATRRRGRGIFAVGAVLMVFAGVGGTYAWPSIQEFLPSLLERRPAAGESETASAASSGAARGNDSSRRPSGAKVATKRAGTSRGGSPSAGGGIDPPVDGGGDGTDVPDLDEEIPEDETGDPRRPGQRLFGEEPIDMTGNGQGLDLAMANLEQGSSTQGLRVEREIGQEQLRSIYLDEGNAVVRRFHPDGWDMAPSASDGVDAEGRALGAKQIDTNRVNSLIRAKFPKVKNCLVGTGGFKGGKARVVVQFTLQPSGRIENLSVVQSDIKGARFDGCVTRAIRSIQFPKPKEQSVIVQFPFVFFYQ